MKTVGFTSGTFDLLHRGHISLIQRAKTMCDILIVGVATDSLCYSYKGTYPYVKQEDRQYIVSMIKGVDCVVLQDTVDKCTMFDKLKFNILFVGDDWYGHTRWIGYEKILKEQNVPIIYLSRTPNISSTILRDRYCGNPLILLDIDNTIWPFDSNEILPEKKITSLPIYEEAFHIIKTFIHNIVFCSRSKHWCEILLKLKEHGIDIPYPEKHAVFHTQGLRKTPHITFIKHIYNVPYGNMLLFDDDERNCQSAQQLGVRSVNIDKNTGLTWEIMCRSLYHSVD